MAIKLSKSSSYFSDGVGFWDNIDEESNHNLENAMEWWSKYDNKASVDNDNSEVITIISTVKSKTKIKDLSY